MTVKLDGGLPKTATWVKLYPDGTLVVDFYDYSEEAHRWFGNDVAYLFTIAPAQTKRIQSMLFDTEGPAANKMPEGLRLLERMKAMFGSYFEIGQWLDENDILYEKTFDPFA